MALKVKDSDLANILACPYYYKLQGSNSFQDPHLYLVNKAVDIYYTNALKNDIADYEGAISTAVNKAVYQFSKLVEYPDQFLVNYSLYLVNLLTVLSKEYSFKDYLPITGNIAFETGLANLTIESTYSILFKSKNSNSLTAVCFYRNVDSYSNNYFDSIKKIKLSSLFKIATTFLNTKAKIPAYLHCIYIGSDPKSAENAKSISGSPYVEKVVYEASQPISLDYFIKSYSYIDKDYLKYSSPIPNCLNKKCLKRKECFNAR